MWLLLADPGTPISADPISWLAALFVIAPASAVAVWGWWQADRRANRLSELLEASHQRELTAQAQTLPVLTRAVDALEDALVAKRGGQ